VALLGGGLKTKQHITGRLADALAEMYFLSAMLKRFEDDGEPVRDLPVLNYCAQNMLYRFYAALDGVLLNFPNRFVGFFLRRVVFPLGRHTHPAKDHKMKEIVRAAMEPSDFRDALSREIYINQDPSDATGVLELALAKVVETEEANARLEKAVREGKVHRFLGNDFIAEAITLGVITENEATALRERETLVSTVIAVDHFDPSEIGNNAIVYNTSQKANNDAA
jgi:acyl-CoA dehydrogenase